MGDSAGQSRITSLCVDTWTNLLRWAAGSRPPEETVAFATIITCLLSGSVHLQPLTDRCRRDSTPGEPHTGDALRHRRSEPHPCCVALLAQLRPHHGNMLGFEWARGDGWKQSARPRAARRARPHQALVADGGELSQVQPQDTKTSRRRKSPERLPMPSARGGCALSKRGNGYWES